LQAEKFGERAFYCFTLDIDWASEEKIEYTLDLFETCDVRVTPFVTHESKVLAERFSKKRNEVGLHPNFLPGSPHGSSYEEVVSSIRRLWPEAIFYRSHAFFDNSHTARLFAKNGFKFDSNLCLFLQDGVFPLKHSSGLLRFPVGWEDDVHLYYGLNFDIGSIQDFLSSPGLKIFNIHPMHVYANTPSESFRLELKAQEKISLNKGLGVRTLVLDILQWINDKGLRCYTLPELYKLSTEGD
jgi:hypothetical protein